MSAPEKAATMVAAMRSGETGVFSGAPAGAAPENAEADLFAQFEDEVDGIGGAIRPPVKRGAGRPPGSVNRTTLQLQRFLLARGYRDPAEMLAALASADTLALAKELAGYSADFIGPVWLDPDMVVKVLGHQRAAAADLMPYFHQRAPVRLETTGDQGDKRTLVVISSGPTQVNVGASGQHEQNQALSVHAVDVSDGMKSDEGGKP